MIRWLVIAVGLVSCDDAEGPRLSTVAPPAASRGATVEITGRGLCSGDCETAGGEVQLGLSSEVVLAPVVEYTDDRAVISIPQIAPVGRTQLVITVNEQASNALAFEVLQ